MLPITLSYKLTEKGQRTLLKSKSTANISQSQSIEIPHTHESYDALVDMAEISSHGSPQVTRLSLNCTGKNSPYLQIADENSIRIFSSKTGWGNVIFYVEADRSIELSDILFIAQMFLLDINVREQIKIKEQEQIAALKEEAASKDMECSISTEISAPNFAELVAQLRDGTYVPTIHVTYKWELTIS